MIDKETELAAHNTSAPKPINARIRNSADTTKRVVLLVALTFLRKSGYAGSFQDYPYGLLSIATYCKVIADIHILDLVITDDNPLEYLDKLEKCINTIKPEVVGFSVMFDSAYAYVSRAAKLVKQHQPGCPVVLGGAAISTDSEIVISTQLHVDAVCYSEGEVPFFDLLLSHDMHHLLLTHKSWVTRQSITSGKIPRKSLLSNLDQVIDIDYSFLRVSDYELRSSYIPTIDLPISTPVQFPLITSRGCPFKCTFCWHSGDADISMRYASVEKIIAHLERLVADYGLNTIAIYDDQLLLNRKRAKDLFKRMSSLGCRVELPNGVTVGYIDEEMVSLMHAAGVRAVRLAIESGDPFVLSKIIKKPLRVEIVKPVVELLHKYSIWVIGFFVIGMPGENDAHRIKTIELIKCAGIDWSMVSTAVPCRGSALWQECIESGYVEKASEFVEINFNNNIAISTPEYSAEYLSKFAYFMNLDVNFVNNRGMAVGEYKTMAKYFLHLTSVYPDHAFAHYYLAKALSKLGEFDQANNHHEIFRKIIHENAEWNGYASIFGLDGFDEGVDSEDFVWPPTAPSS